ncbi:exocyst complex component 1-like isoform X2 [Anneissia japonica]|uniref:exocyst complex component 1-like isoform X2 n=1 Tax=Anneissia japonica TaxID=1529436 RepID=UPI00142583CE|nr:exocyst complex component 1-like isoform X2 [Anneissia japonica]
MTAIRHTLQRDVFLPQGERLIDVVHVSKTGKKKKSSFLCAAITTDSPICVSLYKVKKADKENFRKRQCWPLAELKLVDGKDAEKDLPDFDLHFEKVYKWIASNEVEKNKFITTLWKLSSRYQKDRHKPELFINVKPVLLEETLMIGDQALQIDLMESGDTEENDYHALSKKEEEDLKKMMNECDFAIGNAEAFMERLSNDLSVLDGDNIHSIIESQQEVARLMNLLDDSLRVVNKLETKLNDYDEMLEGVRAHMDVMEQKDSSIQVQNQNQQKLLTELEALVKKLELPHRYQMTLLDGGLSKPTGISECTQAAQILQQKMEVKIHDGFCKMNAVIHQQELLGNLQDRFAQRLATHLNNMFIQQGNEMAMNTLVIHTKKQTLPKHHNNHRDLVPFSDLVQWLKRADFTSYKQLSVVYTDNLKKLYEKELKDFFESAKQSLTIKPPPTDAKKFQFHHKDGKMGSQSDLTRVGARLKSATLDDMTRHYNTSDADLTDSQKFDSVFTQILNELQPTCEAEQEFCSKFFGLGREDGDEDAPSETDGAINSKSKRAEEKKQNTELRHMMSELFYVLEPEMKSFIRFAEKIDPIYILYMLVRISRQVLSKELKDSSSFLSIVLANCLVEVKRNVDNFVDNQVRAINDTRVSKKSKCGIIPFVVKFERFAEQAESIFKGTDRRADLDKSYSKLISAQFKIIHKVALEHQKTPSDVIIFENFHHLHGVLSRLKITCLENEKREAKQKYQEHIQAYVTTYLGRPMEKLNHFFEGVQTLVTQGVKEEEVGFQMAYNKQELRKLIREYTTKEVKKGLDNLYKKVEKTLCEEESLLQVVWRSMQQEFIHQYNHIQNLIKRCYPGANLTLEFTIDEVLQFFSNIAQSH